MAKKFKSNALRILESNKIAYEILEYEYDEDGDSFTYRGDDNPYSRECCYKTIVCKGDHDYLVACIPLDREIDLKALGRISNNKRVELINHKDLLKTTGYVRGGCSPVGMKKQFTTYFDEGIVECEKALFSAGKRGYQMAVAPEPLIRLLKGCVGKITRVNDY